MTGIEVAAAVGAVAVLALNVALAFALRRQDTPARGLQWVFVAVTSLSAALSLFLALN